MALKVNPMELADLDAVLGLQDHIILIDTADLTVHTKKDITVAGGIVLFMILPVCLLFYMLTMVVSIFLYNTISNFLFY